MGKVSQAPRCQKCGKLKEYSMERGIYRCLSCAAVPRVRAAPLNTLPSQTVPSQTVPSQTAPSSPNRVELPLEQLEQAVKNAEHHARRVMIFDCKSCGAQVETPAGKPVSECLFCGRKTVLEEKDARTHGHQVFIPFRIELEEAVERMREHVSGLWLRPGGLASRIDQTSVRKVYLPFWCYDVNVSTQWSATSRVWEEPGFVGSLFGKEGRYRRVPMSGHRTVEYDDWLVCASRALPAELVRQLEPFDTEGAELRACDDELDGVPLEIGTTSPRLGWERAQLEIRANEYDACYGEGSVRAGAQGGNVVALSGVVNFGKPLGKAAVLPLYIFSIRTAHGPCQVAVNGETGRCGAKIPYSFPKLVPVAVMLVLLFGLAVILTGGLIVPAVAAYYLYKLWKGKPSLEARAAKFRSG